MQWQDSTVVVTGGAGFVGSHLVDALLERGAKVTIIDNFVTGRRQNIEHLKNNSAVEVIEADLTTSLADFWPADLQPTAVFHLASPASPPRYQAKPIMTYLVNSWATHQLLQHLKENAPQARFLFASTSEVYGDPAQHPQPESYWGNVNPNGARSCYDEAKRLGETICGVFYRDFGFDARIVRIFNTYGPRMDPDDGRVIPNFAKQALTGQPITIYGDGSQTRSYCFVSDLVAGLLALMEHPEGAGQTVNLGNPGEFTVLETAQAILEATNSSSELVYQPLPKDDPTRRKPDIEKAKSFLNWEPTVPFSSGLAETISYFQSQQGN